MQIGGGRGRSGRGRARSGEIGARSGEVGEIGAGSSLRGELVVARVAREEAEEGELAALRLHLLAPLLEEVLLRLDQHRREARRVEVQIVLARLVAAQVRREALELAARSAQLERRAFGPARSREIGGARGSSHLAEVEHCLHDLLGLGLLALARLRRRLAQLDLLQGDGLGEDGVVPVRDELPREQRGDAHDVHEEAEHRDGHHVSPASGVAWPGGERAILSSLGRREAGCRGHRRLPRCSGGWGAVASHRAEGASNQRGRRPSAAPGG